MPTRNRPQHHWVVNQHWMIMEILSDTQKEKLRILACFVGIQNEDSIWGERINTLYVGYNCYKNALIYQPKGVWQDKLVTYREVINALTQILQETTQ